MTSCHRSAGGGSAPTLSEQDVRRSEQDVRRCLLCGSRQRIEQHHPGREVDCSVTVPLCKRCHERIWRLEESAGVHREIGSEPQRAWSILHGFMLLLGSERDPDRASGTSPRGADRWFLTNRATLLRLVNVVSDEPIGPDPVSNVVRKKDATESDEPRSREAQSPHAVIAALAHAISEMIGDQNLAAAAAALSRTESISPEASDAARVAAIEAVGIAQRLTGDPADPSLEADVNDFHERALSTLASLTGGRR